MSCDPLFDYEVSFVTSIPVTGASPTGTMSLTADGWCVTNETRLPPPQERRAAASSQLTDGTLYPSMTYENRMLELRLTLETTDADELAAQLQRLHRELDKARNVLMFKPKTTEAVYYKTWRATSDAIRVVRRSQNLAIISADIPADPFGYGSMQHLGIFTVKNDPYNLVTGVSEDFEDTSFNITWTDGGDAAWARSNTAAHAGTWSFRAGAILDNQESLAIIDVPIGAKRMLFWYQVSSELNYDFFIVTVKDADGNTLSVPISASGTVSWTQAIIDVEGAATVTLEYDKDVSGTSGSDTAWVDDILFLTEDSSTNAIAFDITGVKGDVETPAFIVHNHILGTSTSRLIAMRRRGDTSRIPLVIQAEEMTSQIADTTLRPNDATASGVGSNYMRTTFTTSAAMSARLEIENFPVTPGIDLRGVYRIFVRVRRDSSTSTAISVRMRWGPISNLFTGTTTTSWSAAANTWAWVDLGLLSIPTIADPIYMGPSNEEVLVQGLSVFQLEAQRVAAGPINFDWDFVAFIPADDSLLLYNSVFNVGTDDEQVVDGDRHTVYPRDTMTGAIISSNPHTVLGGFPMLSPAITNRMVFIRAVGAAEGTGNSLSAITNVSVSYWPRYIYARPELT